VGAAVEDAHAPSVRFRSCQANRSPRERRVRATTAFNKMLAIPGAGVAGVTFTPAGIVVVPRRRARRLRCLQVHPRGR
jgi:hypothetical protein